MAEQRTPEERQQQLVLIAEALLAAGSVAELAELLTPILVVPFAVARQVAEIAIVDVPEVDGDGFIGQIQADNLIFRAAYIRAAAVRLSPTVLTEGESTFAAEEHYFSLHQQQELRRVAGGLEVAEAMDRYGPVLGWYATIRPTNRPNHRAAHEHNFRPVWGPPVMTEAYPGVLPHCLCEAGPPIEGAEEIR